ncbi:molybdenum ABC transporter ATP-binding protein [Mangrovibrevibacter kandeliae]|uniref:molybdenum ABC transporter ATP-binding protein n=1 Tax=Mangrovibrevibacter kandeliae TaxID=2968473 RepID=UPI00211759AB|nr:molybdenum ABC transporter ATP-binding protein [Aurantimonas sp. CSK15Z-1]MCQ8782482.1 molybdenum ABC transporter ATP-binding protein [Aurantimonas sp. CSK15Z-1]
MNDGVRAAFRVRRGGFALDVAFKAPARGITALHGPSGSGKTSILRALAGLDRLDGRCTVAGEVWQDDDVFRPPHRRAVGYIFQEPSLFAHLSVRDNLIFGMPRRERRAQGAVFDETVERLGITGLLDRDPRHLSGGERQRVAIGRALLSRPRLMLMDEPLAALDPDAKDRILELIEELPRDFAVPVVYVGHDMREIERIAHHIVLVDKGRILAEGPLGRLQADPTLPLSAARDAAVAVDATVAGHDAAWGLLSLAVGEVRLLVPGEARPLGAAQRLRIAASDVSISLLPPVDSSILNSVRVAVAAAEPAGPAETLLVLDLLDAPGQRLLARISRRSFAELDLRPGRAVHAQIKGVALAG